MAAPNCLTESVANNIISYDVKRWLRSVLLEKHVLWIIEQLRRVRIDPECHPSHYMKMDTGIIITGGGGRDIVLHKARTDHSIDVLVMKPLRKYGSGVGAKILSRFRPSKLFLSQIW